jgi:polyphosphate kinase
MATTNRKATKVKLEDPELKDDALLEQEAIQAEEAEDGDDMKPHGRDLESHRYKRLKPSVLTADELLEVPLKKLSSSDYLRLIMPLHVELLKLQNYVKHKQLRVAAIFEGRDAAGKGGTIKRFVEHMNPRGCRVVALQKPTEAERHQWYFQRYVQHLPTGGEIVLFDRSWYNRAMVERVMDFCKKKEAKEFLRSCPEFERMLIRSDIRLFKFYFSVSKDEQARRFDRRLRDPLKQWKLSPVDLASKDKWQDYTKAKEDMFY